MPQDWGNLFFKLSLAEALEEVATRVAEEAWLNNENAFYFCFYYIHDSNLSSYIRFSKTYPQWSLHPLRFPRSRGTETFLTVKEGSTSHLGLLSSGEKKETALHSAIFSKITPSLFTLKEGSTSHLGLLPSGKKRETALLGARNRYALRLADHQRSSPDCAGWDRLTIACLWSEPCFAGWDRRGTA